MFNTIEEALADLKSGKIVIVVDDESRENEGDFVALSDCITTETINFMITHGKGLVCSSITSELAEKLNLPLMTTDNTDPYQTAFTVSIDHINTTTGISAAERALSIKELTNPHTKQADYKRPGHIFPLIAKENGVLSRQGHTEASVDLAQLSGAFPSAVICEIIKEDGEMARVPDLFQIANAFNLKIITIEALVTYRKQQETVVTREAESMIPTQYGEFKMIGFKNNFDNKEHLALVKGDIDNNQPILTRIHSECLTGDVFKSYRCDCGDQLDKAMRLINLNGSGVIVYMRQEGRGIGLFNKLRAYELQNNGLDTVEANHELGFAADLREYYISAAILKELEIKQVDLLTNNPHKISALRNLNILINKRVPLELKSRVENDNYLKTKKEKLNHLLILNN